MPLTSLPKVNKPNLKKYPLDTLNLFLQLNREDYEKAFGVQPPDFDVNQPQKLWFDTSPTAGNYTRMSINKDMTVSFIPMIMTPELAASVNIPGAYRYPRYTIPATAAEFVLTAGDGGQVRQLVPANQIATFDQARALAMEMGGTTVEDPGWPAVGNFRIDWKTETRRMFNIYVGTLVFNAGWLLQQKNVNGVGAPGAWALAQDPIQWVAKTQPTQPLDPNVKPIPVPVRIPDADEEIVVVFGNIPVVRQKGAFPSSEGSDVAEILRLQRLLLTRFSIPY